MTEKEINGTVYKVLWGRTAPPNGNRAQWMKAMCVFPSELNDAEIADIYKNHIRTVENIAIGQVAIDVTLMAASELAAWKFLTQRVNHFKSLSLRPNSYPASEKLAGSYVSKRQLLSEQTTEGVYKFVVDAEQKIWLCPVTESLPHSALVPKGAKVHGAGYAWVKNGRANVNGSSGHYMADMPFLGEQLPIYDNAIRQTFRQHGIEVLEHHPSP